LGSDFIRTKRALEKTHLSRKRSYAINALGSDRAGKPAFIILAAVHAAAALLNQVFVKDGTLNGCWFPRVNILRP
jgi:cytochrome b561